MSSHAVEMSAAAPRAFAAAIALLAGLGVAGTGSAGAAPAPDFSAYRTVDSAGFETFHAYGWVAVQFTTTGGIRCRMPVGADSFQNSAGATCWGALPGVPAGVNMATVTPGYAPPSGVFKHADEFTDYETYIDDTMQRRAVDPASYHLLSAGEKIVVPGSRDGQGNDAVCAVTDADALSCAVQNMHGKPGETHGFTLSPQGSRVY